jgi:hypothetical protein
MARQSQSCAHPTLDTGNARWKGRALHKAFHCGTYRLSWETNQVKNATPKKSNSIDLLPAQSPTTVQISSKDPLL